MAGLFDPIKIKGLELKNRIVMAPMATGMATPGGGITDRHLKHYSARARGGVSLVIIEHTYVAPEGRLAKNQTGLYGDNLVPDLKRLVDAIHNEGAKAVIQITHAGAATSEATIGTVPVGPSAVLYPNNDGVPKELSDSEIAELKTAFKEASRRALEAGCDSVELHGAHGFLLNQFMSPLTNKRTDTYGGSLENRVRFAVEVVGEVKTVLPDDVPLFYRFGADDLLAGGLTQEEGKNAAVFLEKAGVDVLDISAGIGAAVSYEFTGKGFFVPLAEGVKEKVSIPVIGVGNITEPEFADSLIREGRVDLAAIGRKLLAEPNFPLRAARELGIDR